MSCVYCISFQPGSIVFNIRSCQFKIFQDIISAQLVITNIQWTKEAGEFEQTVVEPEFDNPDFRVRGMAAFRVCLQSLRGVIQFWAVTVYFFKLSCMEILNGTMVIIKW